MSVNSSGCPADLPPRCAERLTAVSTGERLRDEWAGHR